jgi:hypothetical protein
MLEVKSAVLKCISISWNTRVVAGRSKWCPPFALQSGKGCWGDTFIRRVTVNRSTLRRKLDVVAFVPSNHMRDFKWKNGK